MTCLQSFSAWRPDMTKATRERIWSNLGLDRLGWATDEFAERYDLWRARVFVASLEADPDLARVARQALQAAHVPAGHPEPDKRIHYRVRDIVHALETVQWAVEESKVPPETETTELRAFLLRLLIRMDRHGWDGVDIQFH